MRAILLLLAALLCLSVIGVNGLDLGQCNAALGMESGAIADSDITASSAYDAASVGPQHGRLRHDRQGGAWCPRHMVSSAASDHLQVDLQAVHAVTAVRTQGRFGNGQGQEYAEAYLLEYWRPRGGGNKSAPGANKSAPGGSKSAKGEEKGGKEGKEGSKSAPGGPGGGWVRWRNRDGKQLLAGNTNTYTVVEQKLDPPVLASRVRILPYSLHVRTVCMRIELVGCRYTDGIVSYAMPQGARRHDGLDLTDRSYDGQTMDGRLHGGLGQLVDGRRGSDGYHVSSTSGRSKAYDWVGWRNDSRHLDIVFEFDQVRNFSAVHLHTSNLFSRDVQVFSQAKIFFSLLQQPIDQHLSSQQPVSFAYMPDLVLEEARTVTVKLHHRLGRFVRLQLYFSSRWIVISEIAFDSVVVGKNLTVAVDVGNAVKDMLNPLQSDEVQKASTRRPLRSDRKPNHDQHQLPPSVVVLPKGSHQQESTSIGDSRPVVGLVIGVLSAVILALLAAIVFIVWRGGQQRLRRPCSTTNAEIEDEDGGGGGGVGAQTICDDQFKLPPTNDYDKAVVYCEPSHQGRRAGQLTPDYTDVCTAVSDDYAEPLPQPQYYAGTELSTAVELPRDVCRRIDDYDEPLPQPQYYAVAVQELPRDAIRPLRRLGATDTETLDVCRLGESAQPLALRACTQERHRAAFTAAVHRLAALRHAHVAPLVGACLRDSGPACALVEHSELGDLCQFLQERIADSAAAANAAAVEALSYGCLIYMATQIASGMKYLEASGYVHKDLAARNCLVFAGYTVKVTDLGAGRAVYAADYCCLADSRPLPVRWMAWESVLLDQFSSKSDVWSFAVTLWEVLTFAREQPFEDLSDEDVLANLAHFYQDDCKHILLAAPFNCPKEIFDLMCECWQRCDADRPNFREIHLFLQRKNLGFKPANI